MMSMKTLLISILFFLMACGGSRSLSDSTPESRPEDVGKVSQPSIVGPTLFTIGASPNSSNNKVASPLSSYFCAVNSIIGGLEGGSTGTYGSYAVLSQFQGNYNLLVASNNNLPLSMWSECVPWSNWAGVGQSQVLTPYLWGHNCAVGTTSATVLFENVCVSNAVPFWDGLEVYSSAYAGTGSSATSAITGGFGTYQSSGCGYASIVPPQTNAGYLTSCGDYFELWSATGGIAIPPRAVHTFNIRSGSLNNLATTGASMCWLLACDGAAWTTEISGCTFAPDSGGNWNLSASSGNRAYGVCVDYLW